MTVRNLFHPASLVIAGVLGIGAGAIAQQPPAAEQATPTASAAPANLISLDEVESRLRNDGIRVEELKLRGHLVEAEGRDGSNREVEVIVDRRNGEVVSKRFD
ncbi:MAG: PepSY domain-containing protein [Steroidobacteraceae bacterium]|nr:PepSY domain-containing protein [Steroidobacteraceae bacterium]